MNAQRQLFRKSYGEARKMRKVYGPAYEPSLLALAVPHTATAWAVLSGDFPQPAARHAAMLRRAATYRWLAQHGDVWADRHDNVRHARECIEVAERIRQEAVTCPACHTEANRSDCWVERTYVWVGNPVGPGGNQEEVDEEFVVCGICGHKADQEAFGLTTLQGLAVSG